MTGQRATRRIFVSYKHDPDRVRALDLRSNILSVARRCGYDIDVCIDSRSFQVGHALTVEVQRRLDQSDLLVVVLSEHTVQSDYVNDEIDYWLGELGRTEIVLVRATAGVDLRWDRDRESFSAASALPLALSRHVASPFVHVDAVDGAGRRTRDVLRRAGVSIVAAVVKTDRESLDNEDARKVHRQRKRWRIAVAVGLVSSVAIGTVAWSQYERRNEAERANLDEGRVAAAIRGFATRPIASISAGLDPAIASEVSTPALIDMRSHFVSLPTLVGGNEAGADGADGFVALTERSDDLIVAYTMGPLSRVVRWRSDLAATGVNVEARGVNAMSWVGDDQVAVCSETGLWLVDVRQTGVEREFTTGRCSSAGTATFAVTSYDGAGTAIVRLHQETLQLLTTTAGSDAWLLPDGAIVAGDITSYTYVTPGGVVVERAYPESLQASAITPTRDGRTVVAVQNSRTAAIFAVDLESGELIDYVVPDTSAGASIALVPGVRPGSAIIVERLWQGTVCCDETADWRPGTEVDFSSGSAVVRDLAETETHLVGFQLTEAVLSRSAGLWLSGPGLPARIIGDDGSELASPPVPLQPFPPVSVGEYALEVGDDGSRSIWHIPSATRVAAQPGTRLVLGRADAVVYSSVGADYWAPDGRSIRLTDLPVFDAQVDTDGTVALLLGSGGVAVFDDLASTPAEPFVSASLDDAGAIAALTANAVNRHDGTRSVSIPQSGLGVAIYLLSDSTVAVIGPSAAESYTLDVTSGRTSELAAECFTPDPPRIGRVVVPIDAPTEQWLDLGSGGYCSPAGRGYEPPLSTRRFVEINGSPVGREGLLQTCTDAPTGAVSGTRRIVLGVDLLGIVDGELFQCLDAEWQLVRTPYERVIDVAADPGNGKAAVIGTRRSGGPQADLGVVAWDLEGTVISEPVLHLLDVDANGGAVVINEEGWLVGIVTTGETVREVRVAWGTSPVRSQWCLATRLLQLPPCRADQPAQDSH